MTISTFDLFKIGIGPSSSHTVGPMRAALTFVQALAEHATQVDRISVTLHGSLAATGIGHATDRAVIMGLMGHAPDTVDPDSVAPALDIVHAEHRLAVPGLGDLAFDPDRDIVFDLAPLPYHPNALSLRAWHAGVEVAHRVWYSVGGGFIVSDDEAAAGSAAMVAQPLAYPFATAAELLAQCRRSGLDIASLMRRNEEAWRPAAELDSGLWSIWQAMRACIDNGLSREGRLPGGLEVSRRAHRLHRSLQSAEDCGAFRSGLVAMDWLNLYALAVNEENAAGGRVVTAPTNGAAGIIPAVLNYYMSFDPNAVAADVSRFLLAAAAVGILCKTNASLSGAEVGCQGEVGSACAMAAAGLAQVMGGTPEQVEHAAEIGLEHNLGLTCDPIAGLVQVPCIERNAIAAVKAVNAAQMALRSDGTHIVSLDQVIRTMRDTGKDMSTKYKETSMGGLAVSWVAC